MPQSAVLPLLPMLLMLLLLGLGLGFVVGVASGIEEGAPAAAAASAAYCHLPAFCQPPALPALPAAACTAAAAAFAAAAGLLPFFPWQTPGPGACTYHEPASATGLALGPVCVRGCVVLSCIVCAVFYARVCACVVHVLCVKAHKCARVCVLVWDFQLQLRIQVKGQQNKEP